MIADPRPPASEFADRPSQWPPSGQATSAARTIGPSTQTRLRSAEPSACRIGTTQLKQAPKPQAIRARGVSAFVTVQEGCDKFCAFCVVPYTRGAEFSRPVAQVMAEVERLAEAGVRDVTLSGQNVKVAVDTDIVVTVS